ncbi:6953_t:CDS:2 [Cetraspora pellucida]|uniref:6953_t:CDS:1 n=1 Tax=Cetraspora pellucida TaxID=1433469 RepID=A0A9N9F2H5_9GLOM|nr:6953_t:CDS:2 [Cetraspora pellucida]
MSIPPSVIIENSQGNKRRHDEDEHDDRKKVKIPTLFDCDIEFKELEIIRRIAEGGFGIVYKVLWNKGKQNEQTVAIKVVSNTATQQSERDFKREITTLRESKYCEEHIIQFYGLSQNPKTEEYYLVMQYANNGNLQDYLKENKNNKSILNLKTMIYLNKSILKGLDFLHRKDIIHRDLHSKNVLIHDGNPLLADFGLSKSLLERNEGHISEVRGIQAYVDPKLLSKTLNSSYTHTKRSDIYSFGVVMWEIYTCRLPFNGRNDKHLTLELCSGEREKPVDGMPISYKEVYEKCWEHNPSYRYDKISDILKALDNIKQTPIYSEESKDISLGLLKKMDIDTEALSNEESDLTKVMELSISTPRFLQSFEKLFSEIQNSCEIMQLNKRICAELHECIILAEYHMKLLNSRNSRYNYNTSVTLKDMMLFRQNVENIKKFIENISNIRGLELYIQKVNSVITLERINNETTKLLVEFNESMSSLFQTKEPKVINAIRCDFKDVNTMFNVIKKVMNQLANNLSEDKLHDEQTIIVNKINSDNHLKIGDSIVFCKKFDLNQRKDIFAQATLLKSLEGLPNVTSFYRIVKTETSLYFATEWSEYGNLKDFITRNELNFQIKSSFVLDICKGLVFLNAVNVLHHDIRPENIIVMNYNMVKITNFDSSRLLSDVSQKIDINQFNIRYSAPELLKREPNKQYPYDFRCEPFASIIHTSMDKYPSFVLLLIDTLQIMIFGILLWEILFQKPPYEEHNDPNELKKLKEMILRNENVNLKNSIKKLSQEFSQEYKDIIIKTLDFEPAIRPTICDMFKILHSVLNDDRQRILETFN